MRIIFVRHGEPDYANDCLTGTGHEQAEACAERLAGEGIAEIYASPCGRAAETAEHTARRLHLPVTTLDYMHEISWGGEGIPSEGHPWTLGDALIEAEDFDFYASDWREHPFFNGNRATDYDRMIAGKIDEFLLGYGYKRAGTRYFSANGSDQTIAIFSHGGSGACALSHILSLPFPYVCSVMPYDFTSISIVDLPAIPTGYIHPRLELFNDCAHIHRDSQGPLIQQKPDGEDQGAGNRQ